MLQNKKKILYLISFLLVVFIFFYIIFNYILYVQKNNQYQDIVNKELNFYNDYKNSDYDISYDYKSFSFEEISDFYIDYSKEYSSTNSKIELLFSNNKLSFLIDSIYNWNNSIDKLLYIDYFNAFSFISWYQFTNNINRDYYFLNKYSNLYSDLYNFSLENIDYLIDNFFVLSYLEKNELLKDDIVLKKLKQDLYNNYERLDISNQLYLIFYLDYLGDWYLEDFLSYKNYSLENIFEYNKLNINNKAIYLYLLENNDIKIDYDISLIEKNFDKMNYNSKLFFVSLFYSTRDDSLEYYNNLEKSYKNYDLNLKNKFLKSLLYKNLFVDYSSFDNYSKFWYACWYVVNRKKEYEVWFDKKTYYYADYSISRIEYDWQIDSRVASFEWDKFYLQVTIKQK